MLKLSLGLSATVVAILALLYWNSLRINGAEAELENSQLDSDVGWDIEDQTELAERDTGPPTPVTQERPADSGNSVAQLVLRGTLATGDDQTSQAMILRNNSASPETFRVGDALSDDVTLSAIGERSVVLQTPEGSHTLDLGGSYGAAESALAATETDRGSAYPAQAQQTETADGDRLPTRRSRSGPLLDEEKRKSIEAFVLDQ